MTQLRVKGKFARQSDSAEEQKSVKVRTGAKRQEELRQIVERAREKVARQEARLREYDEAQERKRLRPVEKIMQTIDIAFQAMMHLPEELRREFLARQEPAYVHGSYGAHIPFEVWKYVRGDGNPNWRAALTPTATSPDGEIHEE